MQATTWTPSDRPERAAFGSSSPSPARADPWFFPPPLEGNQGKPPSPKTKTEVGRVPPETPIPALSPCPTDLNTDPPLISPTSSPRSRRSVVSWMSDRGTSEHYNNRDSPKRIPSIGWSKSQRNLVAGNEERSLPPAGSRFRTIYVQPTTSLSGTRHILPRHPYWWKGMAQSLFRLQTTCLVSLNGGGPSFLREAHPGTNLR